MMTRSIARVVAISFLLVATLGHRASAADLSIPSFQPPPNGVIPNEKTAIAVGKALIIAAMPESEAQKLVEWSAFLHGTVWHVGGAPRCPRGSHCLGRDFEVWLEKSDGRVLGFFAGQ